MAGGHSSEALGLAVAAVVLVLTFGSLLATGLPLLTAVLGVGIGGLAVKVLAEPLGICGRRTGPPRAKRRRGEDDRPKPAMGVRWARPVVRRPVAVLLGGIALLGVIAVPAASLETGLPGDESKPASTTQRRAYDLVAEGFGPGHNGPLTVVVQADGGGSARTAAQDVAEEVRGRKDVAAVVWV